LKLNDRKIQKNILLIFYNSDQYLYSSIQKKETFNIPNLYSAKFQNIEVKRKIETIIKSLGSKIGFGIPLNKANSTIYGYFINREISKYDINDLFSLYKNNINSLQARFTLHEHNPCISSLIPPFQ
jgi:hypothetical protein